jgi:microcompartment protein CcmK/EutM
VRLLIAQPEDARGVARGEPLVVADPLQAGVGQRVQLVHGREAALTLPSKFAPIDVAVVALVDGSCVDVPELVPSEGA